MQVLTPSSEEIAAIRVLVPDLDAIYGPDENEYLFTDAQYSSFFSVGRGSVLRAAGFAMIAVGNSEAMIQKVLVHEDQQTDGSKLQDKWRLAGERLLIRADHDDNAESLFDEFILLDFKEGWYPAVPELTDPPTIWG